MAEEDIIDPSNGMFNAHAVYHSPGPGGAGSPLGGILDFLNAFKGQDLANQSNANRRVQNTVEAQKLQPMDYDQVPGMADMVGTSTGLGAEGASAMEKQLPAQVFRTKIAALQQQYPEGIPSSELEAASLGTGQNTSGIWGYQGRQLTAGNTADKNFGTELQRQYAESVKQALTDKEARRKAADLLLTTYPQHAAALEAFVANGTDEPTPMAKARKDKTVAQTGQAEAAAGLSEAKTDYTRKITDPAVREKLARSGLLEAQTKLAETREEIEQIKAANGGVLPEAQKPRYMALLAQLETRLQAQSAQAAMGMKPDPSVKNDLLAQIKEVKAKLGGTAASPSAPAKKRTYNPATDTFE